MTACHEARRPFSGAPIRHTRLPRLRSPAPHEPLRDLVDVAPARPGLSGRRLLRRSVSRRAAFTDPRIEPRGEQRLPWILRAGRAADHAGKGTGPGGWDPLASISTRLLLRAGGSLRRLGGGRRVRGAGTRAPAGREF